MLYGFACGAFIHGRGDNHHYHKAISKLANIHGHDMYIYIYIYIYVFAYIYIYIYISVAIVAQASVRLLFALF